MCMRVVVGVGHDCGDGGPLPVCGGHCAFFLTCWDWLAAVGSAHQSHGSGGKGHGSMEKVMGDLFKMQLERGAGLV